MYPLFELCGCAGLKVESSTRSLLLPGLTVRLPFDAVDDLLLSLGGDLLEPLSEPLYRFLSGDLAAAVVGGSTLCKSPNVR